jgi:hypothetical protein
MGVQGFRLGQEVVVPHQGQKRRVQIRNLIHSTFGTQIVYFIDRTLYFCPAEAARRVHPMPGSSDWALG